MQLEEIRQALLQGGAKGDKAIVEALTLFPEIRIKAYNNYGDGIIMGFFYGKESHEKCVNLLSFGDHVDRSGSENLSVFISSIERLKSYIFKWREGSLNSEHSVFTAFNRECLDEAYRQAAEWLSDENIMSRQQTERAWTLVLDRYRKHLNSRYPSWTSLQKYQNGCRAALAAVSDNAATLKDVDDNTFVKAVNGVFLNNEKYDKDLPTSDGKPVYETTINLNN